MSDDLALAAIGADGQRWDIAGPDAGDQYVWLMKGPKQFYESPAITYWIQSGGGLESYQGSSFKMRKPLFGLVVLGRSPAHAMAVHAELRKSLGAVGEDVFTLEAQTEAWGTRTLSMRHFTTPIAFESGEWEGGKDPHLSDGPTLMIDAACEMPHWKGETLTGAWTLPAGTAGSNTILHPGQMGDVATFPRWTINAPAKWNIPDPSWGQEADFQRPAGADIARQFPVVQLNTGEDSYLHSDESTAAIVTVAGGLGPWMRSNGDSLIYPVKGFTPPTSLAISVTGAVAPVTATIEVDQLYSMPWAASL